MLRKLQQHPLLAGAGEVLLDAVLPQGEGVRVPGRQRAEVELGVREGRDRHRPALGEQALGDPALVEHLDRPGVDVAEGKPVQEDVVGLERVVLVDRFGVRQEVAVREHHPLGVAGGAAGVDDRGEVVAAEGGFSLAHEARAKAAVTGAGVDQAFPGQVLDPSGGLDRAEGDEQTEVGEPVGGGDYALAHRLDPGQPAHAAGHEPQELRL